MPGGQKLCTQPLEAMHRLPPCASHMQCGQLSVLPCPVLERLGTTCAAVTA